VEELSARIKAEKPHLKFGISPFGVWRNIDKDSTGSKTRAGQTNYDDLYADVVKWLREGWIDYVTPQLYWHLGFEVADYRVLVDWWSRNTYGRHLYIGQGAYRIGGKGWEDPMELTNQIALNRTFAGIQGSMFFSSKIFLENKDSVNNRMRDFYRYRSLVPVMDWLPSESLAAPDLMKVTGTPREGLSLEWKDTTASRSAYYVVYRLGRDEPVNLEDATRIVGIVQRRPYATQQWTDHDVKSRRGYTYAVTAVSRLHRESPSSNLLVVRTRGKGKMVRGAEEKGSAQGQ
jgi:hypothetical protein